MKPTKTLIVLAFLLAPGLAAAQGYYGGSGPGYYSGPPPTAPGGFHDRTGRLGWGLSLGLGGMHDAGSHVTSCNNCNYNPIAVEVGGHIGVFLSPRIELIGEFQSNLQTVYSDAYNGDTVLSNNALLLAGQFWITPQLWAKGGIGLAHLQADDTYFQYELGNGSAVMGAVGYEVMSARNFAVDIQGRLIQGQYNDFGDTVTSGTVGLGVNWY